MYELHFRRNYDRPQDYTIVGPRWFYLTLEEAREARRVSGDLVVHRRSQKVVNDPGWLWDWERALPICYAKRAMQHDNPVG